MLRSEHKWFLRFLLISRSHLKWVMNLEAQDYEWMKCVTECVSGRQVESVLRAYNQPHFHDLVHYKQEQAKKIIAIEDGLRSRGCVLLLSYSSCRFRTATVSDYTTPTIGVGGGRLNTPPPPSTPDPGIGVGTNTNPAQTNVTVDEGGTRALRQQTGRPPTPSDR